MTGLDLASAILSRVAEDTPTDLVLGVVVTTDSAAGTVDVNVNGNTLSGITALSAYSNPAENDVVLVLHRGHLLVALGAVSRSGNEPLGTVTNVSTADGVLGVSTDAGQLDGVPWLASYANPAVGDAVGLLWTGDACLVAGRIYQAAGAPPPSKPRPKPPPPPPPRPAAPRPPQTGTRTFAANGAGSYRSGRWRNDANGDVIQGTAPGYPGANTGAWFYGSQIPNTLRGASVTAAWIWLARTSGGVFAGQTINLSRHNNNSRPGGNVSGLGGNVQQIRLAVGQSGWFRLNNSIAQGLINYGGGLGIQGSPYIRLFGPNRRGMSGSVRIQWRR